MAIVVGDMERERNKERESLVRALDPRGPTREWTRERDRARATGEGESRAGRFLASRGPR